MWPQQNKRSKIKPAFAPAVLLPGLVDVQLQGLRHGGVGLHLGQVVVGLRVPAVHPVEFEHQAGLAMQVTVLFFADALLVCALARQPLLVELAGFILPVGGKKTFLIMSCSHLV